MSLGEETGHDSKKTKDEGAPDYFDGKWWNSGGTGGSVVSRGIPERDEKSPRASEDGPDSTGPGQISTQSPAEKVRIILLDGDEWEKKESGSIGQHALFCQLDVFCTLKSGNQGWKEMARWLQYEEKVEQGNRWSKPHVTTTSLHSLFSIRESFSSGDALVVLDVELKCEQLQQTAIADALTKMVQEEKKLSSKTSNEIHDCLMKPHKPPHRKEKKNVSITMKEHAINTNMGYSEDGTSPSSDTRRRSPASGAARRASIYNTDYASGGRQIDDLLPHKPNKKLLKKIPPGTEAANIMIGHCEFLSEPMMVFVRLAHAHVLADMTEVDLPTRFIFLAIGPTHLRSVFEYEEIGRAMGGLLSDKIFCQLAYKAKSTQDLVDGVDEYIDGLTVLPPSIWDPQTRLDPPQTTLSNGQIEERLMAEKAGREKNHTGDSSANDEILQRTGKLLGGLVSDIKRRYPLYWSDIKDALSIQCLASVIFLYFACITPIVTFGGLLGDGTDNYMGTMETILSGAVCGTAWALFSGQPLIIVGATGPMLIFETLLYSFSTDRDIDFLSFRFWIGMWVVFILLLFVVFDLSVWVRYITRFTEESFAVLISLIFIYEAFKKTCGIWDKDPVNVHAHRQPHCYCTPPGESTTRTHPNLTTPEPFSLDNFTSLVDTDCVNSFGQLIVNHQCVAVDLCTKGGWQLVGDGCDVYTYLHAVPDVFLLSVILFLGTFTVAYAVRTFKTTRYFPTVVRSNVSAFAVLIAILLMCTLDILFDLDTPKLNVPSELKTTREDRGWLVNPSAIFPWYIILVALVPAVLAVILIFLDQQITAVIVNRKENKLKKGHGYHLDLALLAVLIGVCSLLGLPWFVAATVRSVTHVNSLVRESETSAPGVRPEMLGVREQRMTGLIIHILIGLSIFITGVLQYVPMAVLYGVFLYMGVTSLAGVQFTERISLLFMPQKYQPDKIYLRHVETKRVHVFTIIQIICMIVMWVVKSIPEIAIGFPLMILAVCFVRKAMDKVFTQSELYWLDHLLPEAVRRRKEDLGDRLGDESDDDDDAVDDDVNDSDDKNSITNDKASTKSMAIDMEGSESTRM